MRQGARKPSKTDIYHVVARGTGKRIIFEDDEDRLFYLSLLRETLAKYDAKLLAWCLMDNHVHLLPKVSYEHLSPAIRDLNRRYAIGFNKRYEREGHLFQERFRSEPVEDDRYLLTVIRYIHRNPERAGLAPVETYRWSSYREYIGQPKLVATDIAMSYFPNVADFRRFHLMDTDDSLPILDIDDESEFMREQKEKTLLGRARNAVYPFRLEELESLSRGERNEALHRLKEAGLSYRQIERFTGISKSVIGRA